MIARVFGAIYTRRKLTDSSVLLLVEVSLSDARTRSCSTLQALQGKQFAVELKLNESALTPSRLMRTRNLARFFLDSKPFLSRLQKPAKPQ